MTFEEAVTQATKAGYLIWHLSQGTSGSWRARLGLRGKLSSERQHEALRTGRDMFFTDTEAGETPADAIMAALASVAVRDAIPVHERTLKALESSFEHRAIITRGAMRRGV